MAVQVLMNWLIPASVVLPSVSGVPPILIELAISEVTELRVEVTEPVEGDPETQTVDHLHHKYGLEVGAVT